MKHNISPLELATRIKKILPQIIDFRRDLHRYPEKGMEEVQTARKIRLRLAGIPGEILPPFLGSDTVMILSGKKPGPNITLRADIDALELDDSSGVPWASRVKGLSHSCGHDGHTAILMGTALVLSELQEFLNGTVRFIFQPGEEGFGGGRLLVEKGVLEMEPIPAAVYALHGWPGQPLNTLSAGSGPAMAACDRFAVNIYGKGGHGARPNLAVDPILTGSAVVQALQSLVSRNTDPMKPAVLSVCSFQSGKADNVIPGMAILKGTTRYFDPGMMEMMKQGMERIIKGTCSSMGASYDFDYIRGYIPLINNSSEVDFIRQVCQSWLGEPSWIEDSPAAATAEDFAYYLDKIPGALIRLGLGEGSPALHNPEFDFDDLALERGISVLAALVLEKLGK